LQRHVKTHRPFCGICEREFSTSHQLRLHMERHDAPLEARRRFPCEIDGCDRSFTRRGALKVHVATFHNGERSFCCSEPNCGASFGHKHLLVKHSAQHSATPAKPSPSVRRYIPECSVAEELTGLGYDKRQLPCEVEGCSFRYSRKQDLTRHLQVHRRMEEGNSPLDGGTQIPGPLDCLDPELRAPEVRTY
jgi:uncharacterized Zn-finger protein